RRYAASPTARVIGGRCPNGGRVAETPSMMSPTSVRAWCGSARGPRQPRPHRIASGAGDLLPRRGWRETTTPARNSMMGRRAALLLVDGVKRKTHDPDVLALCRYVEG